MKKNLLLFAGLLAISFSSPIFSYVFRGVNLTSHLIKLNVSQDAGASNDIILAPYRNLTYINELDFGGVNCFGSVQIKNDKNKIIGIFEFRGLGCRNVQLEFTENKDGLFKAQDVDFGKRDY